MRRYAIACLCLLCAVLPVHSEDRASVSPTRINDTRIRLTTLQFLQQAADTSRTLADNDAKPETDDEKNAARFMRPVDHFFQEDGPLTFPRERHIQQYYQCRPWAMYTPWERDRVNRQDTLSWTLSLYQAPSIRELLHHEDPAIRAMAVECLATMHVPEDVQHIAALLDDNSAAPPWLGYNMSISATLLLHDALDPNVAQTEQLVLTRSWRQQTVSQYAHRALEMMTGRSFADKTSFDTWWQRNGNGLDCLWYWQCRFTRELRYVTLERRWQTLPIYPDESHEQYQSRAHAMHKAAVEHVYQSIAKELSKRSPEVQAKVYLLANSDFTLLQGWWAGDFDIDFNNYPPQLHLSRERLFELLEHKNWWPDVPDGDEGRRLYYIMSTRIGIWADRLFTTVDVPRLRTYLKPSQYRSWHPNPIALTIGISRLLPPATPDQLDDPDTRDGTLRHAVNVAVERDGVSHYELTRELIRVGLPNNRAFLTQLAFAKYNNDTDNQITQEILQELAQEPLTREKQNFLTTLLLDVRFVPLWTRVNTTMGQDMCRQYGIRAINAHAGKELIGNDIKQALTDPQKQERALTQLYQHLETLRQ